MIKIYYGGVYSRAKLIFESVGFCVCVEVVVHCIPSEEPIGILTKYSHKDSVHFLCSRKNEISRYRLDRYRTQEKYTDRESE